MKRVFLVMLGKINNMRDKIAIPVFVVWAVSVSMIIGNIDRISMDVPLALTFGYTHFKLFLIALLLLIRKPVWQRALYCVGFCLIYFACIGIFSPPVPYDAPASVWIGMINFGMNMLPIMACLLLYALWELILKGFNVVLGIKSKRVLEVSTFVLFVASATLITLFNPFLRGMLEDKRESILESKGYIISAGNVRLEVPEKHIKDFRTKRIDFDGMDKGWLYASVAGDFIYELESRTIRDEISKVAFKTRKNEIYNAIRKAYENHFRKAKNLKKYEFIETNYNGFPDFVRMGYKVEWLEDGKDYVKLGIVIVIHTRVYIDVSVRSPQKYYDNGVLQEKLNEFIGSLRLAGKTG